MKRLLEWKQRMLQSPLTRKPSGSLNRSRAQNELSNYYKQQALLDLAAHEASVTEARHHSRRKEDGHRSHVRSKSSDGRRTVSSVSRYNSYSSDDEGRDASPELIIWSYILASSLSTYRGTRDRSVNLLIFHPIRMRIVVSKSFDQKIPRVRRNCERFSLILGRI